MQGNETRAIATFFIWTAFALGMLWGPEFGSDSSKLVFMGIIGLVALLSTAAVWNSNSSSERRIHHAEAVSNAEKSKRSERTRVARLADVLDDDEAVALMDELKQRLSVHNDGEVTSLDDLLAEREAEQRRANR